MQNIFGGSASKLQLLGFFAGSLLLILGWLSVSGYAQTVTVTSPSAGSPVWVGATGTSPHPCNSPNINVSFDWSGLRSGYHSVSIDINGVSQKVTPTVNGPNGSATRTFTANLCSLSDGRYGVTATLSNTPNPPVSKSQDYAAGVDQTLSTFACAAVPDTWSASDVSRACTASDGTSGLVNLSDANFALSTNVPVSTEDANALTGIHNVCDVAGNCTTAGPLSGNKVDKKAPVLQSCQALDGLWHAENVTLTCSYTDGGSGPISQTLSLSTSVPTGAEDSNASASTSNQACDAVGNCATAPVPIPGNKVDKKAPVVNPNPGADTCSLPGNADWCRGTQTAGFSSSEAGSGLAPVDGCVAGAATCNFTQSTTANGSAINIPSGVLCDMVGNCAASIDAGPYKIDSVAPMDVSGVPNRSADYNSWYNHPIDIAFIGIDITSGIAGCTSASYNGPDNASALLSGTCTDNAGNTSNGAFAFKYDATAPTITCVTRTPTNANGWNSSDVTVIWNCTDNFSGPVATAVSQMVSSEGRDQLATATCVDNAGNSASDTQRGINIDKTPPSTSLSIGEPKVIGSGTFVRGDTPFTLSCSDALSGCATSQFRIDGGTIQMGASFNLGDRPDGAHTVEFCSVDLAANVAAFAQAPPPIITDNTPPVITITSPADGAILERGISISADFDATDAGSGLALLNGPVSRGSFIDTSTVGFHEFIVISTDRLGNRGSLARRYQVLYLSPEAEQQMQGQLQQDLQGQLNEASKKDGFRRGDKIKLWLEFKDPRTGKAISDALIRANLFKVLDPVLGKLEFIRFLGTFAFDAQSNQYGLEFATADAADKPLPADPYQIEIFFNDGTSIRVSFTLS
jgi:hypothetical protein